MTRHLYVAGVTDGAATVYFVEEERKREVYSARISREGISAVRLAFTATEDINTFQYDAANNAIVYTTDGKSLISIDVATGAERYRV